MSITIEAENRDKTASISKNPLRVWSLMLIKLVIPEVVEVIASLLQQRELVAVLLNLLLIVENRVELGPRSRILGLE